VKARQGVRWLLALPAAAAWRVLLWQTAATPQRPITAPVCAPWPEPEPEWPPFAPPEDDGGRPVFTVFEEDLLRVLAERLAIASDGARNSGEVLAGRLADDLPGMAGADIARVLLRLEPALGEMADQQPDPRTALRVIADALLGAAPMLAEVELALAEEARRWL
jgi:hypothetical protein